MSLFSRPAWGTSRDDEGGDSASIFSHRKRFSGMMADEQRRKKERKEEEARKEKAKEERREKRRSSSKHKREKDDAEDTAFKKRRITLEDGEALLNKVGLSAKSQSAFLEPEEESDVVEGRVRRSPRKKKHVHSSSSSERRPQASRAASGAVEINDDGDDEVEIVRTVQRPQQEEEDDESDEEIAELKRQARQRRQEKEQRNRHSETSDHAQSSFVDFPNYRSSTPSDDPIVQLLIHSKIEGTKSLIVQRRLSQRLEEVRKAWCRKQDFAHESWSNIFLVHRGRRMYDVNTPQSLGLEVDAWGNLTMKGVDWGEEVDKVHLEAVTKEMFAEMEAQKEIEAKRRSGELPPADAGAANEPVEESIIRLVLRAKDREDFKMKVKPVSRPIMTRQRIRPRANLCLDHSVLEDRRCVQQKCA